MSLTRTYTITFIGLFGFFSGGGLFAQNSWETLPVFHDGRVMPLHTFAQQTVREICGMPSPFIFRDDAVLGDFRQIVDIRREQDAPELGGTPIKYKFLTPAPYFLDGGINREYSPFDIVGAAQPIVTELAIQGLDPLAIEQLANRIRQLIPVEGRYFTADELFFSWVCEPEVWQYIPIFLVPETDYLDEMFDVSFRNDARTSQYRISLHQLENSLRYKQRLAEIARRHELGQTATNPVPFDQITERLAHQAQLFRELTFHPQRHRPTKMLSLLYQAAGFTDEQPSFAYAFNTWGNLLTLGDVPGRQSTTRLSETNDLTILHPTTQRWHDIEDQLLLLMRAYDHVDSDGNPVFPYARAVEQQYEILIDLIDKNLAEAAAIMKTVYPGVEYHSAEQNRVVNVRQLLPMLGSPDNQQNQTMLQQTVISYYYAVKKLRREIEAAYLALYDNGRTFRFLPIRSPFILELDNTQNNAGIQPWATFQMILGSGEPFVKRFFDPQVVVAAIKHLPVPTEETEKTAETTEEQTPDEESVHIDSEIFMEMLTSGIQNEASAVIEDKDNETHPPLMELFEQSSKILPMKEYYIRLDEQSVIGHLRTCWKTMYASYVSPGGGYRTADFFIRSREFQGAVRTAAQRIETHRRSLLDEENDRMVEQFVKTAYPDLGAGMSKLLAEYRYDRLHPFYWMWVFALIAVVLNGSAYIVSIIQREREPFVSRSVAIHSSVHNAVDAETDLQDYTNTLEEWLFISSVVALALSMFIALIGGMMRAFVTGWAPVTNMYETVVMTALVTAMIGVWYALYPMLHPALKLSWIYSRIPRISTLRELYAAIKAQKAAPPMETSGEAAMREAAADFGVLGTTALGGSPVFAQNQGPEVFQTLRRVRSAQRKVAWQCSLIVPRLLITFAIFYAIVLLANGGKIDAEQGFLAATTNVFATSDVVDWLAVVVSVVLLVWIVPHLLLTLLLIPIVLFRPGWIAAEQGIRSFESRIVVEQAQRSNTMSRSRSEMSRIFQGEGQNILSQDTSGAAWLKQVRNAVLDRKLFIAITAAVVFMAGLAASLNRVEFNPDIRPIAAVLRSNFWLTVHVAAFIVGYAAALNAWGLAVVSLGHVVFGRYQRTEPALEGKKRRVLLPDACQHFSPAIERLIRIALLMLVAGTVLGGRWADYSWGRFWSWDSKEVWALITIIFLVIVFHGKIARYYGTIGITLGALFASIAVIITWYGINFVFKGSIHSYGGGTESNAKLFLIAFIVANILWGALALLRYYAEVYGNEAEE